MGKLNTDCDAPSLRESEKSDVPTLGCSYSGYEFGASYPDSVCIDGYLWDADSDDGEGGLTRGGEWACPRCNTLAWLDEARDEAGACGEANWRPWCGAVQWERACEKALAENPDGARLYLDLMGPFEAVDWPDREAVYAGCASWNDTVTVTYRGARKDGSSQQDITESRRAALTQDPTND